MTGTAQARPAEAFALTTSRRFPAWLERMGCSLAFTTYQAGKVFLLGMKPDRRLAVFERSFARCMGLGVAEGGRARYVTAVSRSDVADGWRDRRADGGVVRELFDVAVLADVVNPAMIGFKTDEILRVISIDEG